MNILLLCLRTILDVKLFKSMAKMFYLFELQITIHPISGLTAPPVDENGILPAGPAIFCGLYCIFGIPLFALTLSSFASILVERYIVEEELLSIRRPVTLSEFQFASQSLCSSDIGIHLSDFILLQQFRQGKLTLESFSFMKRHFQVLDTNRSGRLNWNEAQRVIL